MFIEPFFYVHANATWSQQRPRYGWRRVRMSTEEMRRENSINFQPFPPSTRPLLFASLQVNFPAYNVARHKIQL